MHSLAVVSSRPDPLLTTKKMLKQEETIVKTITAKEEETIPAEEDKNKITHQKKR